MRIHRRLEERLADFHGHETALLMGSRYLALIGVIPALARAGEVVFSTRARTRRRPTAAGWPRPRTFTFRHGDVEHLEWGLLQAQGAAA